MSSADVTINRAIGVLMWRHDLDENRAFRVLVDASVEDGSSVLDAADGVLREVRLQAS